MKIVGIHEKPNRTKEGFMSRERKSERKEDAGGRGGGREKRE